MLNNIESLLTCFGHHYKSRTRLYEEVSNRMKCVVSCWDIWPVRDQTDRWNINSELVKKTFLTSLMNHWDFEDRAFKNSSKNGGLEKISKKFMQRWNFPNMIGAVVGKHIVIQQPKNSEWRHKNYEGTYSIILLGMISPEYEFFICRCLDE